MNPASDCGLSLTAQITSGKQPSYTNGPFPRESEVISYPGSYARQKRIYADLCQYDTDIHGWDIIGYIRREVKQDSKCHC